MGRKFNVMMCIINFLNTIAHFHAGNGITWVLFSAFLTIGFAIFAYID